MINTENELGVAVSSWKHCLLYLFLTGSITEETFRNQFISKEELAMEELKVKRANTFDSVPADDMLLKQ